MIQKALPGIALMLRNNVGDEVFIMFIEDLEWIYIAVVQDCGNYITNVTV